MGFYLSFLWLWFREWFFVLLLVALLFILLLLISFRMGANLVLIPLFIVFATIFFLPLSLLIFLRSCSSWLIRACHFPHETIQNFGFILFLRLVSFSFPSTTSHWNLPIIMILLLFDLLFLLSLSLMLDRAIFCQHLFSMNSILLQSVLLLCFWLFKITFLRRLWAMLGVRICWDPFSFFFRRWHLSIFFVICSSLSLLFFCFFLYLLLLFCLLPIKNGS